MAADWTLTTLGDLADLHREQVHPADQPDQLFQYFSIPAFDTTRAPVLEPGSKIGSQKFTVPPGALLVSRLNPRIPRVWLPEVSRGHPAVASTEFLVLRPNNTCTRRFLEYLCLSPLVRSELESRVTGTSGSHQRVRPEDALDIEVLIPSDDAEQRAIAHILGTLDDKIELNRRMSETLEAMARALFQAWFVDFEPVRAKMDGRWQRGQSLPGLPAHLYDLFPDRLVDSELGEIPEGWEVVRLADQFAAVKGVSYKGSGLRDSGMPLHNLNSINEGGGYKHDGIKFYAGEYAERHLLRPGDVIVANTEQGHDRRLIGYSAIVPRLFGNQGIASHHIYRLRRRHNATLTSAYLCHLLNSPRMHGTVSGYANGTTVNMLPIDGVQLPLLVCPPQPLVATFDSLASSVEQRNEAAVAESQFLAGVRDMLLPKLISGEVRLQDAERFLAGAEVSSAS